MEDRFAQVAECSDMFLSLAIETEERGMVDKVQDVEQMQFDDQADKPGSLLKMQMLITRLETKIAGPKAMKHWKFSWKVGCMVSFAKIWLDP
jgi:hypothetical protein